MSTVGFVFDVWFEHYCMEIVVDFPGLREFELVCQIAELFDDRKRSFGLWLEFRGYVHFRFFVVSQTFWPTLKGYSWI